MITHMEQKYRMLEVGEVIEAGDEWQPNVSDIWKLVGYEYFGNPVHFQNVRRPVSEVNVHGSSENSTGKVVTDAAPQEYRMLEVGEPLIEGDEFWNGDRWCPTKEAGMGVAEILEYRRPVAAEETITEVREAWQKDHMEMKRKLDDMTKSWYDQRAELADARNQITDLTRRLEDALSAKVIAEKRLKDLEYHLENEHVASWRKIQQVLPESNGEGSLVDQIIGYMHQLARERDNWMETAAQHSRNQEFYHGLVTDIGNMFGLRARISDDGTICEDVLALRVPELVAELIVENS